MDLALALHKSKKFHGESFNFGPKQNMKKKRVLDVVKEIKISWPDFKWVIKKSNNNIETNLLSLNCAKARKKLNWSLIMSSEEAIKLTAQWYKDFYERKKKNLTINQIKIYEKKINNKKL
jgi:CDP-glucose 4,6-dehydratase